MFIVLLVYKFNKLSFLFCDFRIVSIDNQNVKLFCLDKQKLLSRKVPYDQLSPFDVSNLHTVTETYDIDNVSLSTKNRGISSTSEETQLQPSGTKKSSNIKMEQSVDIEKVIPDIGRQEKKSFIDKMAKSHQKSSEVLEKVIYEKIFVKVVK